MAKMLAKYMIPILLCWPACVLGLQKKTEEMLDQLALPSKTSSGSPPRGGTVSKIQVSTSSSVDLTPVYYQNSNGFIPMINYDSPNPMESPAHQSPMKNESQSPWTNNPVFSPEARLLLTLPNSRLDRRSFQEAQNDFEILKVNNDTPAIANYHEFYENLQRNLQTITKDTSKFISKPSAMRTRDRIRLIDDYFNNDLDTRYGRAHNRRYPQNPEVDVMNKPSVFEPEKVQSNYPQYGASNYGLFGYPPVPPKVSNPGMLSFDSHTSMIRNDKKMTIPKNRHQPSKPVVIAEPSDYHQTIGEVSTPHPYVHPKYEKSASEDRYDRKEDYSDSSDYLEITERPKRIHKSRRRPENSRRPVDTRDRDTDEPKKISGRTKSRGRVKTNYWHDEDNEHRDDLPDDQTSQKTYPNPPSPDPPVNPQSTNEPNVWNQVAPNVELSQSSGYEINQLENPNLLVPINVNLVPISNFPVSNAGISSVITATPIISSTASPMISTSASMLLPKLSPNPVKTYGYSTPVPDVIVGQNTLHSPVQAVLLPQMNKYSQNGKPQYLGSTVAPMFTISQQFSPTIRAVHSTQSPKITALGNAYGPQVFLPQSTMQTLLQTPMNSGNYNFVVNRGQDQTQANSLKYGSDSSDKRNQYQGENAHILTSASYSVSPDSGSRDNINNIRNDNNDNDRYRQTSSNVGDRGPVGNPNNSQKPQIQGNLYPVIRGAQVVPAIIHAAHGISGVDLLQNHGHQSQPSIVQPAYIAQIPKASNQLMHANIFDNNWRLQQVQVNDVNKNRYQSVYGVDSLGSTTNNNVNTANNVKNGNGYMDQAHLPNVGTQTVEIRNPNINIKPSPIDLTMVNPVETVNHYATAVLTTPIPILSTTAGFLTPRPIMTSTPESISIQSYVDSLTQIGSQNTQGNQPNVFNPLNFIPNWDLIKSQTMLNNKVHLPRPLPHQLNLVPVVPGGNFDKHSPVAQVDLINKPKLSSDLEKYAEEMFRESLRTIYNTHKWNTDKRVRNLTDTDIAELERLKSDLSRFKAAMIGGNGGKDLLEAHHSETKFRAVEPGKNSGLSTAVIEQLFKSDFKINGLLEGSSQDGKHNRGREKTRISDYLTPPKVGSYTSKTPFVDNISKKRPGKGPRYEGIKSRPHSKTNTRPVSPDTSASNHVIYSHRRPSHDRSNSPKGYKKSMKLEDYPSLTTAFPDIIRGSGDHDKSLGKEYFDINHPRMHNLLGLLMKNKQLPSNGRANYFLDEQENKRYADDERPYQTEGQFYDDSGNFRKKSDSFGDIPHTLNPPKLENFHR
ncbi:uncharacterized protein LOC135162263 [Diachasmimorpha longicaudata]|uniref:uncharacterized protein LOC135162263 n=1 Tax=Diachasmimorpha longicaudata TaxID=58733 RepID=UPI0030B8DAD3